MLTSSAAVRLIPGLNSSYPIPDQWLDQLVAAASVSVKRFLKRNIELKTYTDYYSGNWQRDVIIRQYPVLSGQSTIALASNGLTLPQSTINVVSTAGFDPGGRGEAITLGIQTSLTTYTTITYTGVTSTTFTGCSGGTGTLSTGNIVSAPVVFVDSNGFFGQATNGFAAGTLAVKGTQWVVYLDDASSTSHRGLLRCIGGSGSGPGGWGWGSGAWGSGFGGAFGGGGKLAAYRQPCWPSGDGNIKVQYSAGYHVVPDDIQYATTMLVAYMIRNQPNGAPLSSESLGSYSYSVLSASPGTPEIGSIQRTLAVHREVSW